MTYQARVEADGGVILPAHVVAAMGLRPGERFAIDRADAGLVVHVGADVVKAGQRAFAAAVARSFTVDDFIADRRAEAADR